MIAICSLPHVGQRLTSMVIRVERIRASSSIRVDCALSKEKRKMVLRIYILRKIVSLINFEM